MLEITVLYNEADESINSISCEYDSTQTSLDSAAQLLDMLTTGKFNKQIMSGIISGKTPKEDGAKLIQHWKHIMDASNIASQSDPVVKPSDVFSSLRKR